MACWHSNLEGTEGQRARFLPVGDAYSSPARLQLLSCQGRVPSLQARTQRNLESGPGKVAHQPISIYLIYRDVPGPES